jgi:hypothetical protein
MSSIPTLKRQVATSQDEYEHLFQKVVKYSRRLQNELNSWKNQQEASDVRQHMRSLFCEPSVEVMCRSIIAHLSPVDYEEEEEDLDIDQTNIIEEEEETDEEWTPDEQGTEDYDEY